MPVDLKPPHTVAELVDAYVASRPTMKAGSARQLRYSEQVFAAFLQSPPTLGHLADDTINQFTAWRIQTSSADTAKRNCDHLILLWTFAADRGFASVRPSNVTKLKLAKRKPDAWTLTEVLKLLVAADNLRGRMPSVNDRPRCKRTTGVPCSQWWTSLILFLRDTGARVSDALSVRPADLDLDGGEVVLQGGKRLPLSRPTPHLDDRRSPAIFGRPAVQRSVGVGRPAPSAAMPNRPRADAQRFDSGERASRRGNSARTQFGDLGVRCDPDAGCPNTALHSFGMTTSMNQTTRFVGQHSSPRILDFADRYSK